MHEGHPAAFAQRPVTARPPSAHAAPLRTFALDFHSMHFMIRCASARPAPENGANTPEADPAMWGAQSARESGRALSREVSRPRRSSLILAQEHDFRRPQNGSGRQQDQGHALAVSAESTIGQGHNDQSGSRQIVAAIAKDPGHRQKMHAHHEDHPGHDPFNMPGQVQADDEQSDG